MTISSSASTGSPQSRTTMPGSARTTLLNVLGEFALTGPAQTPHTGALMQVLTEFGFGEQTARQAIYRCAQSGWIAGLRNGQESRWTLTPAARELLSDGITQVEALDTDFEAWDGTWLIIMSTIPKDRRNVRERFYQALRWNGFGSPIPGMWISAHPDREPEVNKAIHRCELADSTASFTGHANNIGLPQQDLVTRAWDLEALATRYHDMVHRFSALTPNNPIEALVNLLELDNDLQTIPSWDPQLPSVLAPDWPGRTAAAQLLALRAHWLEPARKHWLELQA